MPQKKTVHDHHIFRSKLFGSSFLFLCECECARAPVETSIFMKFYAIYTTPKKWKLSFAFQIELFLYSYMMIENFHLCDAAMIIVNGIETKVTINFGIFRVFRFWHNPNSWISFYLFRMGSSPFLCAFLLMTCFYVSKMECEVLAMKLYFFMDANHAETIRLIFSIQKIGANSEN